MIAAVVAIESDGLAEVAVACLAITWVLFGTIFLVGRKGAAATTTRRDLTSQVGFGIQMVAYTIVFAVSRPLFSPFVPMPKTAEALLTALTIAIGFASIWFCYAAVRTLGKQWALVARVIEGHELIKRGPYGVVRNPIYLAMFGLLLERGTYLEPMAGGHISQRNFPDRDSDSYSHRGKNSSRGIRREVRRVRPDKCPHSFRAFSPKAPFETRNKLSLRFFQHRLLTMEGNGDNLGVPFERGNFRPRHKSVFINSIKNGVFRLSVSGIFKHDLLRIHAREIEDC